ncbi:MAG: amidase [Acidobacteriota bacterium]
MSRLKWMVVPLIGAGCFLAGMAVQELRSPERISDKAIALAEKLIGLSFNSDQRRLMQEDLEDHLANYQAIRQVDVPNHVPPALFFNPIPPAYEFPRQAAKVESSPTEKLEVPTRLEDLAFSSIGQLSLLIRTRQVTSEQLTRMYLDRLKRYGPKLECVVTLTEELALQQARQADAEIAAGHIRGPLHGIPYGAKDLLSTKGVRTTWGSVPFQNQLIDADATVVRRLREAGAVLVAKLTLGELAWGDVWFGGMTRNPWNLKEGSSGSSAGSAAATSAGLVAFAIGSETWGSIVSPSTRCGVTGLRPTYGRVSRKGAMALSWSMDKLGPICRSAEDCALVLDAIYGPDGQDQTVFDVPFHYTPRVNLRTLRIGYLQQDFLLEEAAETPEEREQQNATRSNEEAAMALLRSLGAELIPLKLPALPVADLSLILSAEAAAAFDQLTLSGRDALLKRQVRRAWPNVFRAARFIPAVEYIQANRIRQLLVERMGEVMREVDLYLAPSDRGNHLLLTNLTGHPCVVVPAGFSSRGTPTSITLVGKLFDEGTILAVARAYQEASGFHLKHPSLD